MGMGEKLDVLGELFHLLNILLAVVLGFAIGYERKLRYKEAGIRTHTIVCAGSALIMVVSKYGFGGEDADASRVAAQIVAGATVILIGVQCLFHIKCKFFQTKKYFQVKIVFTSSGGENDVIKEIFQTDRFNRLVIERKGGETVYHATLNTDKEYSSQRLTEIMAQYPFIRSIERCDEA